MSAKARRVLWPVMGLILALGTAGLLVVRGEQRIEAGQLVRLELRPVDPRAMLQGDYMALDYAVEQSATQATWSDAQAFRGGSDSPLDQMDDGRLVLRLDERQVGTFVRFYTPGEDVGPEEVLLRYEVEGGDVRVGSDAWYFQEGDAATYARAEYAEYRVTEDGSSVLVRMLDGNLEPLGPPRSMWIRGQLDRK